jgi:hypothetical protein
MRAPMLWMMRHEQGRIEALCSQIAVKDRHHKDSMIEREGEREMKRKRECSLTGT